MPARRASWSILAAFSSEYSVMLDHGVGDLHQMAHVADPHAGIHHHRRLPEVDDDRSVVAHVVENRGKIRVAAQLLEHVEEREAVLPCSIQDHGGVRRERVHVHYVAVGEYQALPVCIEGELHQVPIALNGLVQKHLSPSLCSPEEHA